MSIVGAFDVHRRQLTFDYLDTVTGEVERGRVAPAGTCPGRARGCCAGRCMRRPSARPGPPHRTTTTTPRSGPGAAPGWPRCRWPASSPAAATTRCANWGKTRWPPPRDPAGPPRRRARPPMKTCGPLPLRLCCHAVAWTALERMSGRTPATGAPNHASCRRSTKNAPRTEIRLGARRGGTATRGTCTTCPAEVTHELTPPARIPASWPRHCGAGQPSGSREKLSRTPAPDPSGP
jgi:hypothetical protein